MDTCSIWSPLVLPAVRIIDLSSTQNLIDVCLQETGGLGVNCAIDSGGKVGTIHNIFAPLALIFCNGLGPYLYVLYLANTRISA